MKLVATTLLVAALSTASAFVVAPAPAFSTQLHSTVRPDATAAIQAALEATKKYGATSPEARVAWDAVEEMDASDNSSASKGSMDVECEITDEAVNSACEEYNQKKEELASLLGAMAAPAQVKKLQDVAADLKAIKLSVEQKTSAPPSPAVSAALKEAQETEAKYGKGSPEAAVAWTELEEIAASGLGNSMGVRLDEECLVESAQAACEALEELNRALSQD